MIKLDRVRTASAIPSGLRGTERVEKELLLLSGKRDGNLTFNSNFWKSAKKQLKAESGGKCAYCEAPTDLVAHGDVEHFRPKSIYWWLAYCYDNYLYSCQICNQTFKGNNFPFHATSRLAGPNVPSDASDDMLREMAGKLAPDPLNDGEGLPMEKFVKAAKKEKPGLVDVYMINPEPLFKWVADSTLREVSLQPRKNTVTARRAYEAVNQCLGLNREELRRWRWQTYRLLETLKRLLESSALEETFRQEIRSQIQEMMSSKSGFAGMVRYFVTVEWKLNLG